MKKQKRKNILTIAGFDPSAGAGILADVKTITALKGYALSVCTANTIQTDDTFLQCDWVNASFVQTQLEVLVKRFSITTVKIGIIQSPAILFDIVSLIHHYQPTVKIVLDPVLRASTAFSFHSKEATNTTNPVVSSFLAPEILKHITVITPNIPELEQLGVSLEVLQQHTTVLLKGGHATSPQELGVDFLYPKQTTTSFTLRPKKPALCFPKHGSGCILSSALATYLAQGYPLLKATLKAKRYTERCLASTKVLLTQH